MLNACKLEPLIKINDDDDDDDAYYWVVCINN